MEGQDGREFRTGQEAGVDMTSHEMLWKQASLALG